MTTDVNLPGLVVDIEARIDKLEKGIAKANAVHRRGSTEMEGRARQSAKKMEDAYASSAGRIGATFEKMFAGFQRGSAALVAVGGAALAFKEIAGSIAEVDREARKAGVSAKTWQQWTYVASATGATIDGVTDALKELNIRGDEFARTGKGSAEEAFKRLGYTATEVAERLKDPSRFLDEIIGKLRKIDPAGQTRILDEIFGGTGAEQMAKLLGLSVEQIQKLRSEAATFTDEQIEAAKKVDAAWESMWRNFMVRAKGMAIEGVEVAKKIIDTINGPTNESQRLTDIYNSPAEQLKRLQAQRDQILADIEREKAGDSFLKEAEIRNLETALKAIEEQILALGGGSKAFNDALKDMSTASNKLNPALASNTDAAKKFAAALGELKNMVPGLKAELDTLAQTNGINTAYQNAVRNARSMGEVWQATDIANRARSVATYGQHTNMLDLIGAAEGTDRGRGYNETLDYGRWTGGAVNLTSMTLDQVRALQNQMLANPANRALYGNGQGSSALGRYQITGRTLESLIQELGLPRDRLFDEATQDELARALLRRRGNDVAGLRNEWEGLRRVDEGTIRNAYDGTPTAAQQLDPSPAQQRQTELLKQQADARRDLNQAVQEGLSKAQFEQSLAGMTESQKRIELEIYERLQQAKRAGISLSDQEIAKLRQQITTTEQLNQKNQQVSKSTEGLKDANKFFAESFTSSLSGLLTGTQSLQDAVRSLANSLVDAALRAALLGQGPLAGLFGTAGGTGILGGLLGFASGGYTGDGGKYEPKGIVHGGEYVVSAKATRNIGVANLEALHRQALKGFASGGYVGDRPNFARKEPKAANVNVAQPITINAPVTVNTNGGGTPEQNADLAKQVAKEMEGTMRGVVVSELQSQMRVGNMLNRR
jgi:muramidase (phage lysozyme)